MPTRSGAAAAGAPSTRGPATGRERSSLAGRTIIAYPRGGGCVRGRVVDEGYSPTHGQVQYTVQSEDRRRLVCVLADEIEQTDAPMSRSTVRRDAGGTR